MKTIKKEQLKKMQEARIEANAKKILDVCGYEIWKDSLNYTTVDKKGKNHYFPTLLNALLDIKDELRRKKLTYSDSLELAIIKIKNADTELSEAVSRVVALLETK
jgi:hypothetical protein